MFAEGKSPVHLAAPAAVSESLRNVRHHEEATVLSPRAVNLPLHLRDGIWQADIHDTELLQSATFVLAVAANMPVDQIQRQFIQQSKISSPEKIRNMVSVQIPGIPLRALMVAPRQLPYHSGFSYFELDKSGQAWTEMAAAGAVALHVSGSFPDLNMQLWAIRGYLTSPAM